MSGVSSSAGMSKEGVDEYFGRPFATKKVQIHSDFGRVLKAAGSFFFRANFGSWVTLKPPLGLGWKKQIPLNPDYWNVDDVAITDVAYVQRAGSLWAKEQFQYGMFQGRINIGNNTLETNVRKSIGFGNVLDNWYVAFKMWDDKFVAECCNRGVKTSVDIDPTADKYLCDATDKKGERSWVIVWTPEAVCFYITPSHAATVPDLVAVITENIPQIPLEYLVKNYHTVCNTQNVPWLEYYGAKLSLMELGEKLSELETQAAAGVLDIYAVPAGRVLFLTKVVFGETSGVAGHGVIQSWDGITTKDRIPIAAPANGFGEADTIEKFVGGETVRLWTSGLVLRILIEGILIG